MITYAPLISWKNMIKIFFLKSIDDKSLAHLWCKENDTPVWFSKTAWSLVAILHWWEKSFNKKSPTIWVPGYFCNQSLWPLRQNKVNLVFYPVKDRLQPDWDICHELAKNEKPDIFILTHFYGIISDVEKTKEFCGRYDAIFVEDAAHVLFPIDKIGEESHFVLYSQHKFFSLSEGALCVIRPTVKQYVNLHGGRNADFATIRQSLGNDCHSFSKWLIRQIAKNIGGNYLTRHKPPMPYELDNANQPMPAKPLMSSWAKKLLSLEQKKIPEYIEHRKKCVETWEYLLKIKVIAMNRVSSGNEKEIPYVAVFNSTYNEAPDIYKKLTKKKWPASSWPDLPPEVRANTELHASTIHFRNNMIIFPVHQSLKITELLRKYGSGYSKRNCK